ncbi:hypothetical protein HELRODRAFT_191499 [Helobdella robusta]|uniref:PDZ domain-containing protein n=1 Tax=Helobdella robusta TaxID=6412 RepID=T1FT16_HELRO|nr:hypothetical protein HELRODRAFT_191499 [Helobdella robusta]ESO04886.1 hypothetical protein HELRODRAFT_191499 [Helobdella robusta]
MNNVKVNDCIIKVNGVNVIRSTAESVAKIVRNSTEKITLDLYRPSQQQIQQQQRQQRIQQQQQQQNNIKLWPACFSSQQQQQHRQQSFNSDSAVVFDYASSFLTTTPTTSSSPSSLSTPSTYNDHDVIDDVDKDDDTSTTISSIFESVSMFDGFHQPLPLPPLLPQQQQQQQQLKLFSNKNVSNNRKPLMTVTNQQQERLISSCNNYINNNPNNINNYSNNINNNNIDNNSKITNNNNNSNNNILNCLGTNNDTLTKQVGCLPRMGIKSKTTSNKTNNNLTDNDSNHINISNNIKNNNINNINATKDDHFSSSSNNNDKCLNQQHLNLHQQQHQQLNQQQHQQQQQLYQNNHHQQQHQQTSEELESQLDKAIEELKQCLEIFVGKCTWADKNLLAPLRYYGIPKESYTEMFQNVHQLQKLSSELLEVTVGTANVNKNNNIINNNIINNNKNIINNKNNINNNNKNINNNNNKISNSHNLIQQHPTHHHLYFIDSLVFFLKCKMSDFCTNYETYCVGLRRALMTLVLLKKDEKFGPIIARLNNNNNNIINNSSNNNINSNINNNNNIINNNVNINNNIKKNNDTKDGYCSSDIADDSNNIIASDNDNINSNNSNTYNNNNINNNNKNADDTNKKTDDIINYIHDNIYENLSSTDNINTNVIIDVHDRNIIKDHIKELIIALQMIAVNSIRLNYVSHDMKEIIQALRQCCSRINDNHKYHSTLSFDCITTTITSFSNNTLVAGIATTATTNFTTTAAAAASNHSNRTALDVQTGAMHKNGNINDVISKRSTSLSSSCKSSSSSSPSPTQQQQQRHLSPPLQHFQQRRHQARDQQVVIGSIDRQLLDIQARLIFPQHIRTFPLATPTHYLVYSGFLDLITTNNYLNSRTLPTYTTLFVVLMSDQLLLTQPDPVTDDLVVFDDPIVLHDIVGCQFDSYSPFELIISVETRLTTLQKPWTPRSFRFIAPSDELKCTWKNILEQRILHSKSIRECSLVSKSLENIV